MTLSKIVQSLQAQGKTKEAFDYALQWTLHGLNTMATLADLPRAIRLVEMACELAPAPALWHNLAHLRATNGDLRGAWQASMFCLDSEPHDPEYYFQHGCILGDMGCWQEASKAHLKALLLAPDNAIYRLNYGTALLACGDMLAGWPEYEARYRSHAIVTEFVKRYLKPRWDGKADLNGKTIVVYNEQGMGDAIQFARYLPMLAEAGAKVIVEVQWPLAPLLGKITGVTEAVGRMFDYKTPTPLPEHDYVVSINSLPYLFGTTLDNIPNQVPYILASKKSRVRRNSKDHIFVGVCWAGNPDHPNDMYRSMRLQQLAPLAQMPNVRLFNLQKGVMDRTWGGKPVNLMEGAKFKLRSLGDLVTFEDTAAAIAQMDIVVSVDTTIAHLAGAMGVPTFMLISTIHDWRWMMERQDSPWYPTMWVMRQKELNLWHDPVYRICDIIKGDKWRLTPRQSKTLRK
jgi:hypothetical protein